MLTRSYFRKAKNISYIIMYKEIFNVEFYPEPKKNEIIRILCLLDYL